MNPRAVPSCLINRGRTTTEASSNTVRTQNRRNRNAAFQVSWAIAKMRFMKAPKPKLQVPNKTQAPNSNPGPRLNVGAWDLELLWSLELGTWNLTLRLLLR